MKQSVSSKYRQEAIYDDSETSKDTAAIIAVLKVTVFIAG